jgi:hypothetical protein
MTKEPPGWWQDTAIALCQLAFVPDTLPTILGPDKPALATSIANSLTVATIAVTQATLGLWLSVATAGAISLVWATLAAQRLTTNMHGRQGPDESRPN